MDDRQRIGPQIPVINVLEQNSTQLCAQGPPRGDVLLRRRRHAG
ncbi:hypothetical protein [Streptomyces parvus]|nr:hypothetical protein [Streptomyces parvus]